MLFQLCRYAKKKVTKWDEIGEHSLSIAIEHADHCLLASCCLDSISGRTAIKEEAETLYANVISRFNNKRQGDVIAMTRTELTNAFAKNPGRFNGLKPSRLYGILLPWLAESGQVKAVRREQGTVYAFRA
jgi:hypothetical protein